MKHLKKKQIAEAEEVSEAPIRFGNFKKFFRKIVVIFAIASFFGLTSIVPEYSMYNYLSDEKEQLFVYEESLHVESVKTEINLQLIKEVTDYINEKAPNSDLNGEFIVLKCLEYDIDITFVLAQALLESHFGTRGKAAETNSVWNVGTYDDGQILYRYDNPDESLEPYLKLITEKYLINVNSKGDTIYKDLHQLVKDRGYINYRGHRFASARGYENGMRKLLNEIRSETSIDFYQDVIRLPEKEFIAFFAPKNNIDHLNHSK